MSYKTYKKYKDSGIGWIGEIPEHWRVIKLKHVINEFVSGGTPTSSNDSFWDENNRGIPWVAIGDMSNKNFVDYTSKSLTMEGVSSKNLRILPKGTLLYSIFASLGFVSILSIPATTNQAILGLITSDKINNLYLKYYLEALREHIISFSNANTQDNLNTTIVKNLEITLTLNCMEQKSIVNFLDKKTSEIDKNIAKNKELISLLEEKKTALINQVVTKGLDHNVPMKDSGIEWIGEIPEHWDVTKMKFLGQSRNGLTYKPEDVSDDGLLVLRSSNIQNGKLSLEDNVFVNTNIESQFLVNENDLLICSRNGSRQLIGKSILIPKNLQGNTFGAFMMIFRSDFNPFISYVLKSRIFKYYLGTFLTSTINQLTLSNFNNMVIPITMDLQEQKNIVNYLDKKIFKIDETIDKINEQIDLLEEYKTSLIHHAVTGKIDVRDEV